MITFNIIFFRLKNVIAWTHLSILVVVMFIISLTGHGYLVSTKRCLPACPTCPTCPIALPSLTALPPYLSYSPTSPTCPTCLSAVLPACLLACLL